MTETTELVPLFGPQTAVAEPVIPSPFDRVETWSKAFHQWLAELPAANTRRAYERAWKDLLEYTGRQPWAIQSSDVRDWIQELQERPLADHVAKGLIAKGVREDRYGYSPSTINQMLAGVSSFFTFAQERYLIIDPHGRERPLHDGINPARAVRRPKNNAFGKAIYLDAQAMTNILQAIPRDTLQGLRDLALFVGFMMTGRRNSEWRTLRWGDIQERGGKVNYVWSGKGKEGQLYELAPPVWEAIQNYLKAARRLGTMQDGDYIFIATTDVAKRLPNVDSLALDDNQPLSLGHCNSLLKKYARHAGLDPARITVHTLRHSFAMLLDELGVDVKTISKRLGHSNLNITMLYLDHMKGVEDQSWRQAAAALKLDLLQRA